MNKRKFYIVWNEGKTEGFVTDDGQDALEASSGKFGSPSSTLGEAFYQSYEDDAERPIEEVELPA